MFNILKKLFQGGPSVDYASLMQAGAQIIDVRTKMEYAGGHIQGSVNIPLQELQQGLQKINKDKPVIICCASGMRSASAKSILAQKGFKEVYNGGSWTGLERKLKAS